MGRIREILAHGGIAVLAACFALGFALLGVADAIAYAAVAAIQQHLVDPETGDSHLQQSVLGTSIDFTNILSAVVSLAVVSLALLGVWRLTRGRSRECPECLSSIPQSATVCRYCTTELPEEGT